jgi:hypothetical protein
MSSISLAQKRRGMKAIGADNYFGTVFKADIIKAV